MLRTLLVTLLGAGLIAAAVVQDKPKEKPKVLPRIAIDDPAKAKADRDFAIQGEYEGVVAIGGQELKLGIQVVAQGEGKFAVKIYPGGLTGAGWDGKSSGDVVSAAREDGKVVVRNDEKFVIGVIADGAIKVTGAAGMPATGTLKKVERKSPTLGAKPPAGAVVLFGGPDDVAKWDKGKVAKLSDGKVLAVSKTGSIKSKQAFGAFKAHIEFRLPWMPNSRGQGHANSGVYVQDRYEIQVLDSFGLTGENNECGGIYTQFKPSVNMCLPPMVWQTYDIDFTPAKFDGGKKTAPARLTVKHNGVTIHDNVELKGPCPGGQSEKPTPGPFQLQDHGDPVVYRNIWVVETK
ncbi:MAG TPA: DUF1080 domain-containing protein [Gemmataceae bacterium]|jgi:hypothetical protein|nr:DUF1080 domain-containing protein [Gemmataceae bacterium]